MRSPGYPGLPCFKACENAQKLPDSNCFEGRYVCHYGASLRYQKSCNIRRWRMVQWLSSLHAMPYHAIASCIQVVQLQAGGQQGMQIPFLSLLPCRQSQFWSMLRYSMHYTIQQQAELPLLPHARYSLRTATSSRAELRAHLGMAPIERVADRQDHIAGCHGPGIAFAG